MPSEIGVKEGAHDQKASVDPTASSTSLPLSNDETNHHKRNAFSELMSPKSSKQAKPSTTESGIARRSEKKKPHFRGTGLLEYILEPTKFPSNIVIRHNDKTVLIQDAFPKATVHLLLLPRDSSKWLLNPRDAFDDVEFLAMMRQEAEAAVQIAASELYRLISPFSESCKARLAAMENDTPPELLPPGRDFTKDVRVGIHAHPSMAHLHVHIISRDMHSDRMKHQKHYNSFNTDFFIPLDDFPLAKDDRRRQTAYQNANLKSEFRCWRCGRLFGNKFKLLKGHLDEEFEEWKRE
ncbi:hypothetical protein ABEF95_007137 [Exophiala dermatitidis]